MKKFLKIFLLIILGIIILLFLYLFVGKTKPADNIDWGVTFSKRYAIDLGLDWKALFLKIIYDLGVEKFRLIAYWDEIEKEQGEYDFSDIDWQIDQVKDSEGEIILALGRRLPRWPECFEPEWIKNFSKEDKGEALLSFVSKVIERYKDVENIKIWQIENEPFLGFFGECPALNKKLLDYEIALARSIDPSRPIMITESGEFSTWIGGSKRADILGTSIYRKIYGSLKFYITYPIPPVFYHRKTNLVKTFFNLQDVIAIEVQAEPWGHKGTKDMTIEEQDISMSFNQFNSILEYIKKTGFDKAYLWGVEWWYWRIKEFNDYSFWNRAKDLF
ncbi:hypothetical protein KKA23_03600 [Patescibacteria group bacterium]|nr:hypothetical protein [Patescibacteria group bacterium]